MKSLYQQAKDLREERKSVADQMNALHLDAKKASRGLTAEEREQWTKLEARETELRSKIQSVESEIEDEERREAALAASRDALPAFRGSEIPDDQIEDVASRQREDYSRGFRQFCAGGARAVSPELRKMLRVGEKISSDVPSGPNMITLRAFASPEELREARALGVGTDSLGGYTVAQDFANVLIESMQAFGGMRRLPTTKIRTATGATLPVPNNDDTGQTGELLGENTQAAEGDSAFGSTSLEAFTYSSKIVRVSVQLMQDSAFDVAGFLARALGRRIGRITNTHFTTGDGSSKPRGVVTGCPVGKTAASATAITADELLDLKHSVDPAYRELPVAWSFADSTLKAIKQLSIGTADARPLWQPGIAVREPDTIDGDPFVVNQDIAAIAASAKSVVYGAWEYYWIRDVRDITLLRLEERYADYLQVGFLAFSRHDGDYMDPGDDAIKSLQQASA